QSSMSDSYRVPNLASRYKQQFMAPPLHEIGSMWMPRNGHVNTQHSSGVDYCQAGWRKWNSCQQWNTHWDMHARSAAAVEPDWYRRRLEYTRQADQKFLNWQYDRYSKPSQRRAFGEEVFPLKPENTGVNDVTRKPGAIKGDIPPVRYGLCHPDHYEEPNRAQTLPPIHDPYHVGN
ncbi:hypothetical protein BOX15_Mlig011189g1, partial [Macrostomum lignano]